MSAYVRRTSVDGVVAYTGPIRSERQAERKRAAWVTAGWTAEVVPSSPAVRAEVRAWERSRPTR